MGLTASGRTLLGYARTLIDINDAALRDLRAKPSAVPLRLGIPADFLTTAFFEAVERMRALFPELCLELETDVSERLRSRCLAGDLGAAFYKRVDPEGTDAALTSLALSWVGAPGFALPVQPPVPLICFPEGCVYRQLMLKSLETAGLEGQIVMTTPSLAALRQAVAVGLGVTALPLVGDSVGALSGLPDIGEVTVALAFAPGQNPLIRRAVSGLAEAMFAGGGTGTGRRAANSSELADIAAVAEMA
jgi:DNA-binding transcriptional LysR family regulator